MPSFNGSSPDDKSIFVAVGVLYECARIGPKAGHSRQLHSTQIRTFYARTGRECENLNWSGIQRMAGYPTGVNIQRSIWSAGR
ncbi:hypothetical protein AVEN_113689-1 [Araneus ventricosus]|uniref:Uncharacterized protein n=1 Tax=Araneus ventricosus TaxID=182803 RepID=A0A4Y2R0V3_ARAVE|nr:hypothetical protein AVEN_113689-1 [Araneus ventricosus]